MKVLLIDNNDSFTYNIVSILKGYKFIDLTIMISSKVTVDLLDNFEKFIISPGPGKPQKFPILTDIIKYCVDKNKPLLGICLGHQAICQYFGATLVRLPVVIHGRQKEISICQNSTLYDNLPNKILVGLYHSWSIDIGSLPSCLVNTSTTDDGVLMSVEHKNSFIYGIQYHPESFLSSHGKAIISNFLRVN